MWELNTTILQMLNENELRFAPFGIKHNRPDVAEQRYNRPANSGNANRNGPTVFVILSVSFTIRMYFTTKLILDVISI